MGFLLGAYGKLAAGSRVRQLQSKMMAVQSRLRRVTKDVANMEKSLNAQKTQELNAIKMYKAGFGSLLGNTLMTSLTPEAQALIRSGSAAGIANMSSGDLSALNITPEQRAEVLKYNSDLTQYSSNYDMMVSMAEQNIENNFENYKEMMLEPLKQEEEELQIEKDTLESQVQIAKEDYEACKKMEQDGAKTFAPQYTA